MRVARFLEEAVEFDPVAVTIGNFDGVHIGHRRLLHEVLRSAEERAVAPAVLTFDPHPASIVAPQRASRLLTTPAERCALMARAGIECALVLPFTKEMSRWTPEQFVERVLVKALRARVVVVGENFLFGHDQAGDTKVLSQLGLRFGFETRIVPPVKFRGSVVSSSAIRRAVEAGHVSLAGRFLARPFSLEGPVVSGHGIGSKQTVPTLNLKTSAQVLPLAGVYMTRTSDLDVPGRRWKSITNVGTRPTFGGGELTIETFLLDSFDAHPPARMRVEFLERIRDERKFDSPAALKAQIFRDVARTQRFFARAQKWIHATSSD